MTQTQTKCGVLEAIVRANQGRKPKLLRLKIKRMLAESIHILSGDESSLRRRLARAAAS